MDHTEYDNYQYSGTCLETIAVKDHRSSFLAVIPVAQTPITTCLEIPYNTDNGVIFQYRFHCTCTCNIFAQIHVLEASENASMA